MPVAFFLSSTVAELARKYGVFAFLAIGLVDQSIIPVPGSMDALVILFVASKPELWWYYALLGALGATVGAFVTYEFAKKGGREALAKRLGEKKAGKAHRVFDRWGFWSIFTGTLLPPPTPIVPFLAVAGVMQYPKSRFLAANASGRLVRFGIVALITKEYGKHIFSFFARYYKPALYSLIALAVVGGVTGLWFYVRLRNRKPENARVQERHAA